MQIDKPHGDMASYTCRTVRCTGIYLAWCWRRCRV